MHDRGSTHEPRLAEYKRLVRIAALIEENLKANLDDETAKLCWFGDEGDYSSLAGPFERPCSRPASAS